MPSFKQDLQVWYNKNKGQSVQEDFVNMQKIINPHLKNRFVNVDQTVFSF